MPIPEAEFFAGLNEEEQQELRMISREVRHPSGSILFYEGERSDTLLFLTRGIVKIYKVDQKGNEVVLHFIQAPSLIAELAHMQHIPYPATALCETECSFLAIQYRPFEEHFLKNPSISPKIIASLCKKIIYLERVITQNLTMDALSRLCRFLYENEPLLPSLSSRKIAAILNMTPETLSRSLGILKEEGAVQVEKRTIVVMNRERLTRHIGEA